MRAKNQLVAVTDDAAVVGIILAEVGLHHRERLVGGDNHRAGELVHKAGKVGRVVGLHVVDDQVVRLTALQRLAHVGKPLVAEMLVDGIEHGNLLIHNDVGIVAYAVRYGVQALEQIDIMVIHAHIADIVGDVHGTHSSLECCSGNPGGAYSSLN